MVAEEEDNIFGRCFDRMDAGMDQKGIVDYIGSEGFPAVEAMIIIRKLYGLSVEQARVVVVKHPTWRAEIEAMDVKTNGLAEWWKKLVPLEE